MNGDEVPKQQPAAADDQQQSSNNNEHSISLDVKSVDAKMLEFTVVEGSNPASIDVEKSLEKFNIGEVINEVASIKPESVTKEKDDCMEVDENSIVTSQEEKEEQETEVEKVNQKQDEMEVQVQSEVVQVEIEKSIDSLEKPQTSEKENQESQEYQKLHYEWTAAKLICKATREFTPTETSEKFTKGCFWSPDGTCILVPSEDFRIRIFELPRDLYSGVLPKDFELVDFDSSLKVKEGGTIYDTCWFPYMNSWDPSTCCFLSTSQGSPVHLWDAFTGQLRATYRAYNLVDEVEAAISLQFTDLGGKIWTGFKNALRVFDTDRPGRQIKNIFLKKDFPNVTGLVSCIRENPEMPGLIAFGTYSKCIGLYKDGPICTFGTGSGVTQIEFSPCGTKLYSAVRRNGELLCWDLRNPGTVLYSLDGRQSNTNQRIWFNLSYSGEEVVSGGTDGSVKVWKVPSDLQIDEDVVAAYKIKVSKDCVNGVALHKNLPIIAASTGERKCDEEGTTARDNSLRFYWLSSR